MSDKIKLLPDAIANQIAAGEVIQRPASIVKELMENAIDAQASNIKVYIKDAGKTLVQVNDNGLGMSDTDARLAIERHATSKIRKSEDLFEIKTMGFRGEALASIAAVSQMEIKTRQEEDEVGTRIRVNASKLVKQDLCQTPVGTNITVKNLFFNVPARRRFLKSNAVEMRHILNEFKHIAIAHPDISFAIYHNGKDVYVLRNAPLKKRIIDIFGNSLKGKLIPVSESTQDLKISGFVGTPKSAKKSYPNQYFFVNKRFIRSSYLNHAIKQVFSDLLPEGYKANFFIAFDVNPEFIDVNVHPTKEEIKFEDQKMVYRFLGSAVRHALGQHNVTPSLDFDKIGGLDDSLAINSGGRSHKGNNYNMPRNEDGDAWKTFYESLKEESDTEESEQPLTLESQLDNENKDVQQFQPAQIHNAYIVAQIKTGMLVIDQQKAHERVLYERFLSSEDTGIIEMQRLLFPEQIELSPDKVELLSEIRDELKKMGFEINPFGQASFILHAIPSMLVDQGNLLGIIEKLLDEIATDTDSDTAVKEIIAQSLSAQLCIKKGKSLNIKEMRSLIEQLFASEEPYISPRGKACFITISMDELEAKFN